MTETTMRTTLAANLLVWTLIILVVWWLI